MSLIYLQFRILGAPLFELIHGEKFVARGVLHGCIGECCSIDFPSVFANLADKEIWQFLKDQGINITYIEVDKNVSENLKDIIDFLLKILYTAAAIIAVLLLLLIPCGYFLWKILR